MDHISQIKARLPISDVVGSYIKLERAGSNMRAICPFHKEKTPSFNVSPSRDAYYCFGCAKGGDIFNFVQEIEGITFPEALKILADKAGVTLPERGLRHLEESDNGKNRLIELMEKATVIFEAQLQKNPEVIEYLKGRGLTEDTISRFRIGYSPLLWRELYDALKLRGYTDEEIERSRLVKKIEGKGYYDTFRGRVMFPISDSSGRVVAFTGRVFGDQKNNDGTPVAKYLNSPEGELYDKSSILYGYDRAKLSIRKNDYAIIVEGQMDCIMSHQAGFDNTVAISGTALTHNDENIIKKNQTQLIKRLTNKIVFALDADGAGIKATIRSAKIALQEDMNVRAVIIPEGKDPADYIHLYPQNWEEIINKSEPIISYLLKLYLKQGLSPDLMRERIKSDVFPLLSIFKSKIAQAQVVSEISRVLQVKDDAVWSDLDSYVQSEEKSQKYAIESNKNEVAKSDNGVVVSPRIRAEEELLGLILWQEGDSERTLDVNKIKTLLEDLYKDYEVESYKILDGNIVKLSIIAESKYQKNNNLEDIAIELLYRIEKEIIVSICNNLSESIKLSQNKDEDSSEYIRKLSQMMKKQKTLEDKIRNHKY